MAVAGKQLAGRKVAVSDVVTLVGGRYGVARYEQRHYAMTIPTKLQEQIDALRNDLLVTEQAPPLTLAAAAAVKSAERGDCVGIGGTVHSVRLEGVIPRFAVLPEAALPFVTLNKLPDESKSKVGSLRHVLMRFDVANAEWVRHRYFFAELEPAAGS
jgi:hypothetical protein